MPRTSTASCDEIRRVFPEEFATARRIIKEEDETLERARAQARIHHC